MSVSLSGPMSSQFHFGENMSVESNDMNARVGGDQRNAEKEIPQNDSQMTRFGDGTKDCDFEIVPQEFTEHVPGKDASNSPIDSLSPDTYSRSTDTEPFPPFDEDTPEQPPNHNQGRPKTLTADAELHHIVNPASIFHWGPRTKVIADTYANDIAARINEENMSNLSNHAHMNRPSLHLVANDISSTTSNFDNHTDEKWERVELPGEPMFNGPTVDDCSQHRNSLDSTVIHPGVYGASANRPPPSSPPESQQAHILSMPTIPILHPSTIPELLDRYRIERDSDPVAFDTKTQAIKQDMMRAKLERGGSAHLETNELTADLASRIDAALTAGWNIPRDHEIDHTCIADDEDDTFNHNITTTTTSASNTHADLTVHIDKVPNDSTHETLPNLPHDFRLSNHIQKVTESGSCQVSTSYHIETLPKAHKKVQKKTYIEITEETTYHYENELDWADLILARTQQQELEDQQARLDMNVVDLLDKVTEKLWQMVSYGQIEVVDSESEFESV